MKKILITGGAGFLGSHLIPYLLCNRDITIFNVDSLSLTNSYLNLKYLNQLKNHHFSKTSTTDQRGLRKIFQSFRPNHVIHLAAHTHVDTSIKFPYKYISENTLGTLSLLEECRSFLSKYDTKNTNFKLILFSTDEVYGSIHNLRAPSLTTSPLSPSNPYSASKASSDLIAQSYNKTFNLPIILCRSTNLYGPRQDIKKFIPNSILSILKGKPIPIYGKGQNRRNWTYVLDCCAAINLLLNKGETGQIYHIATRETLENIKVAKHLIDILKQKYSKILLPKPYVFIKDRPAHDFQYSLDASKTIKLGWNQKFNFLRGLAETTDWYIKNAKRMKQ